MNDREWLFEEAIKKMQEVAQDEDMTRAAKILWFSAVLKRLSMDLRAMEAVRA